MSKKKALIRAAWLVALIWQVTVYVYAFPLMVARVTRNHLPGNEMVNVVCFDLLGVFAWVMFLVFWEDRPFRGSKVLDSVGMGAFVLLATGVVWTSLSVWF